MNAIEWLDTQISGLEIEIGVLKMQRKVLIDASKERKLDELEAALAPKANMTAPWTAPKAERKPRASGVKDAVLAVLRNEPYGLPSGDIIGLLPNIESGSIRQALNGLKNKGEVTQDGKMWVLVPTIMANGAYAAEEMTA